jgi:hypothetical protein
MISNDIIQADFIASLKANSTLTDALVREDEEGGEGNIKESQWAGTDMTFPAVRVRLTRQIPIVTRQNCDHARLPFSIRIMTEGGSSREADVIAGIVNSHFHGSAGGGKFFRGTGWVSYFRSAGLGSANRVDEKLWMAEAQFEGVIYPS